MSMAWSTNMLHGTITAVQGVKGSSQQCRLAAVPQRQAGGQGSDGGARRRRRRRRPPSLTEARLASVDATLACGRSSAGSGCGRKRGCRRRGAEGVLDLGCCGHQQPGQLLPQRQCQLGGGPKQAGSPKPLATSGSLFGAMARRVLPAGAAPGLWCVVKAATAREKPGGAD